MTNNPNFMYIVSYTQGEWDDYAVMDVFVTQDENKARAWVDKANRILEYYKVWYIENKFSYSINVETPKRFWCLDKINTAFYTTIEIR